jgi:hypothetical protein
MTDAEFKDQAEAIQAFLLEHGVDDLAMVEEVFEMPQGEDTQDDGGVGDIGVPGPQANLGGLAIGLLGGAAGFILGGLVGSGVGLGAAIPKLLHRSIAAPGDGWLYERIVIFVPGMPLMQNDYIGVVMAFPEGVELDAEGFPENRATDVVDRKAFDNEQQALEWVMQYGVPPARESNLGGLGMLGLGVAALGVAAAGAGGYLWYRNRQLTQACLGDTSWLEADGSLSEVAEALLHTAVLEAVADGAKNSLEAADAAIVKVSGNPDCRLPVLIWGDLLRVRAATIAMAVHIGAFEDMEPPTEEGPGPDVTGLEANAACTQFTMHDQALAQAYHNAFLDEQAFEPGQDWIPNTIVLGAAFLQRVAPHCGVSVSEGDPPQVLGVDTWQKAAMVGGFALLTNGALNDRGILSDADFSAQSQAIVMWLMEHGVDDLAMIEDVLPPSEDAETDEWGQPVANEVVNGGSVGGEGGGLWRAYKDNVDEYGGQFYFVVWRAGEYTEQGPFGTEAEASDGALELLTRKQAGIAPKKENPRRRSLLRNPVDIFHLLGSWGAGRGSSLRARSRARRQNSELR